MTSFGLIPLKEIWAMLDRCAPGHTRKAREHNHLVTYNGVPYPSLPLGKHGRRENPDIEAGHVKKMARLLKLDADCVNRMLPQLRFK